MKRHLPKNTVILAALITASLFGAYLLASEAGLLSGKMAAAAKSGAQMQDRMPMRKKGVLLEAGLAQEDELQNCYEAYLKREPKVDEGVVEMHWMLDPRGKISSMEMVHSDLEDETFTSCLLDKMKKMTFKAPPKARPTLVAHKFNFHKRSPSNVNFKQAAESKESREE
ncbi:MAG: AgmX/PglI C-terminal domain-containing protein [Bdellovibrionales bacterium]